MNNESEPILKTSKSPEFYFDVHLQNRCMELEIQCPWFGGLEVRQNWKVPKAVRLENFHLRPDIHLNSQKHQLLKSFLQSIWLGFVGRKKTRTQDTSHNFPESDSCLSTRSMMPTFDFIFTNRSCFNSSPGCGPFHLLIQIPLDP